MLSKVNVSLENGKIIVVEPRVWIKNGFFWASIPNKKELVYFKFSDIISEEKQIKQITTKLKKTKLI